MNTYYQASLQEGDNWLAPEEALHCARSHRSRIGDEVELVDGNGHRGTGKIKSITKTDVVVSVSAVVEEALQPCERTWICVAPTKQMERTEWFLEKAVEVGIGRVSFFYSQYSERRALRLDRLQRIVIEACKQCRASRFPRLDAPVDYLTLLKEESFAYSLAFAHYTTQPLRSLREFALESAHAVKLIVGPEGGFTDAEYAVALHEGYEGVAIGERRLRTETAALVGSIVIGEHCNC